MLSSRVGVAGNWSSWENIVCSQRYTHRQLGVECAWWLQTVVFKPNRKQFMFGTRDVEYIGEQLEVTAQPVGVNVEQGASSYSPPAWDTGVRGVGVESIEDMWVWAIPARTMRSHWAIYGQEELRPCSTCRSIWVTHLLNQILNSRIPPFSCWR